MNNLVPNTEAYPERLGRIHKPPAPLYYMGDPSTLGSEMISIVGSRKMSAYGEQVTDMLVPSLARSGLTIVSGLAYGVDSYAHTVALRYGGKCVAVLGSSLDRIYPQRNQGLAASIIEHGGCIVSEYPEGTDPFKAHFPERNRIVAGLSRVLLIIEAGEKSGTLITAQFALDEGREVCVVPADITRTHSLGVHTLLKQGARPVTCADDVLCLYDAVTALEAPLTLQPALTGSMATLYDLISQGEKRVDQLVTASGLKVSELQSVLSVLELDGYIQSKADRWQKTY